MENKLKYAQDLIKTNNSSISSGFNMFISGYNRPYHHEYHDHVYRNQGYDYAEEMARNGKIFFTHNFNCKCGDAAFQYGGFWVCNGCGSKDVNEDFWIIKVEKDGNEFCCHGLDFINLQESSNYAFGETFEESILNYGNLFKS